MLDQGNDLIPPSSPTNSSISSSDLDTESTGSFFHDRSTTLGTLMGVTFPQISFRVPSQRETNAVTSVSNGGAVNVNGGGRKNQKARKKVVVVGAAADRRRRWWKLCRDDVTMPASLGEYLEVERRFGDGVFYSAAAELEGMVHPSGNGNGNGNGSGRLLFADGRVLPPTETELGATDDDGGLCRFPVLLTGICSGGGGN